MLEEIILYFFMCFWEAITNKHVIFTNKFWNWIMLGKFKISHTIQRIYLPVEILHGFYGGLIWDLACSMDPKPTFQFQTFLLFRANGKIMKLCIGNQSSNHNFYKIKLT